MDVIVLSIGPNEAPRDTVTFMNAFDIFLLFARRAGIFVVQAAGNKGPAESTVISYSPWAVGVASSTTGRTYTSTLVLGDGHRAQGVGLTGLLQFSNFLNSRISYLYPESLCFHIHIQITAQPLSPKLLNSRVYYLYPESSYFNNSTQNMLVEIKVKK